MINKELVRPVGSIGQDNLIAHIEPKAHITGISVRAGAGDLKRGTVLYRTADGSYDVYGGSTTTTAGSITVGNVATADVSYTMATTTLATEAAALATAIGAATGALYTAAYSSGTLTLTAVDKGAVAKAPTFTDINSGLTIGTVTEATAGDENTEAVYTVTLSGTPDAGGEVISPEPSIILTEDTDASSTQATAVGYRSGCFNRNALIFADSYTITDADVDTLRKFGIILSDFLD